MLNELRNNLILNDFFDIIYQSLAHLSLETAHASDGNKLRDLQPGNTQSKRH